VVDLKDKEWPDWSEFENTGAREPEHSESKPLKKTGKGADIIGEQFEAMVSDITQGFKQPGIRQPTDQELFGHLVVSEEELAKREADWNNLLIEWECLVKSAKVDENQDEEWGNGKSFNSTLSEEELAERNKYVSDH
jgi:hypothetical protein